MKHEHSIHNLDTLEKEIYRLQLEAKNKEQQLAVNAKWMKEHAREIFVETIFKKSSAKNGERSHASSQNGNGGRWHVVVDKIVDRLSERAAEKLDRLFKGRG